MQSRNDLPAGEPATTDEYDGLLYCRMAMLGLDRYVVESDDKATLNEIKRRCKSCSCRETCSVDLKRDPNDPVWETYCPNSGTFNALSEVLWLKR